MPIKILPEETINKIAAGEVVERPANAVKELVENSLDAQSTSIEIELKGAGRRLIRVRDNGSGIPPDDIELAVTRHATSKISGFDDLKKLGTMGFRGEALPSIAAVSNLAIQSQSRSAASGWEVRLSGGRITKETSWAGAPGTNIEVSDLFFNTPARDKFLKSDTTERSRILKIVEELSLAWHGISFKAVSEGKTVLDAPKTSDPLERIIDVLGKDFASILIPVEVSHPSINITAYITRRENSLTAKNYQFFFVNRRPVNPGRSILHSLYEAYRENLPAGRHPGALIFLEIDPAEIDVNIHPTKREVRFSKDQQIHHLLYTCIKNALCKAPVSGLNFSGDASGAARPGTSTAVPTEGHYPAHAGDRSPEHFSGGFKEPSPRFSYSEALAGSGLFVPPENNKTAQAQTSFENKDGTGPARKIIGQMFNTYIAAQDGETFIIIDQHAAAERIRYEKYLSQWESKKIAVQPLLFPENIELPPSLFDTATGSMRLLNEAGWEAGEFGSGTIRVTAVPAVLGGAGAGVMLKDILDALSEEKNVSESDKVEKIIRAACHASIKAGDTVSGAEAAGLLNELLKCRAPNTCPHGRPTMLKMTKSELARHFGRK